MRLIDADEFLAQIEGQYREHDITREKYMDLEDRILQQPTIEPEPQWISCRERLPHSNGCYLVWRPHYFGGDAPMPAICYFDGTNTWHDSYGVDFERILPTKDVTAWMPLPEPYTERREE